MRKKGYRNLAGKIASWGVAFTLLVGTAGFASASPVTSPAGTLSNGLATIPRLGVEGVEIGSDTVLSATAATDARLVRVQMSWQEIEPTNTTPSNFNWSGYDTLFTRMAAQGVTPLVIVLYCPLWACPATAGPLDDDRYDEFAQFMEAVAARYSPAPYNVHYWEFWNEPDGTGCPAQCNYGWGNHPAKYATMLKTVYPRIKAIDPQSVLMNGGLAYDYFDYQGGPFKQNFLAEVLANGGGQAIDALAFHYYKDNAHGWTNIGLKVEVLRRILADKGVDLPLICTETGWTSSPQYGGSETAQASYLVKSLTIGMAKGLRSQIWYANKDYLDGGLFADSGLLRLDNSRKPSYTAMQILANKIGSGTFLRRMDESDGIRELLEGYKFRSSDGSREISVVWNNGSDVLSLTVPADRAVNARQASNQVGVGLPVEEKLNGTVIVRVGADPVYLERLRFEDVRSDTWMFEYVEYLASRGVIGGYADSTFRPGNPATRGQFAKMIVLGMGWNIVTPATPTFNDVQPDNTFYSFIETAVSRGVIGGYNCGAPGEACPGAYYRPGNNITRAQIAKIVVLGVGWPLLDPPTPTFNDVAPGSTFYSHIETMVARGVVGGYTDGTFRPGNNATRAQLSKMLALSLQQR